MSKNDKPKPTSKAGASAIRREIEELADRGRSDDKKKRPPSSPRDFIQQWMAEHDKKSKDK